MFLSSPSFPTSPPSRFINHKPISLFLFIIFPVLTPSTRAVELIVLEEHCHCGLVLERSTSFQAQSQRLGRLPTFTFTLNLHSLPKIHATTFFQRSPAYLTSYCSVPKSPYDFYIIAAGPFIHSTSRAALRMWLSKTVFLII